MAGKLLFMQSDGGLCLWENFSGLRAILSGPAGGVIGYARACYDPEDRTPVIGFDMGGTSTDVSRFDGAYDHVFESETAEVTLQTPQLDINTVAAGGGSILHWKNGLFAIGPDVSKIRHLHSLLPPFASSLCFYIFYVLTGIKSRRELILALYAIGKVVHSQSPTQTSSLGESARSTSHQSLALMKMSPWTMTPLPRPSET